MRWFLNIGLVVALIAPLTAQAQYYLKRDYDSKTTSSAKEEEASPAAKKAPLLPYRSNKSSSASRPYYSGYNTPKATPQSYKRQCPSYKKPEIDRLYEEVKAYLKEAEAQKYHQIKTITHKEGERIAKDKERLRDIIKMYSICTREASLYDKP